uniref:Putative secreted protein n=1 Tax=Amblyomma triste TaxID=251400 RepID=A0A023G1W2_AMBTT
MFMLPIISLSLAAVFITSAGADITQDQLRKFCGLDGRKQNELIMCIAGDNNQANTALSRRGGDPGQLAKQICSGNPPRLPDDIAHLLSGLSGAIQSCLQTLRIN